MRCVGSVGVDRGHLENSIGKEYREGNARAIAQGLNKNGRESMSPLSRLMRDVRDK